MNKEEGSSYYQRNKDRLRAAQREYERLRRKNYTKEDKIKISAYQKRYRRLCKVIKRRSDCVDWRKDFDDLKDSLKNLKLSDIDEKPTRRLLKEPNDTLE